MSGEAVTRVRLIAGCGRLDCFLASSQRVALLPSVVRMLPATFLENVAGPDGEPKEKTS